MSDHPLIWSVKVKRLFQPWEAWMEHADGRLMRATFDMAWTEKAARRKALRRWKRTQRNGDVPGTKKGAYEA